MFENGRWEVFVRVYICVCITEEMKEKRVKCGIYVPSGGRGATWLMTKLPLILYTENRPGATTEMTVLPLIHVLCMRSATSRLRQIINQADKHTWTRGRNVWLKSQKLRRNPDLVKILSPGYIQCPLCILGATFDLVKYCAQVIAVQGFVLREFLKRNSKIHAPFTTLSNIFWLNQNNPILW